MSPEYVSWQRGITLSLQRQPHGRFLCKYDFPDLPDEPKVYVKSNVYAVIGGHRWLVGSGSGTTPTEHYDPGWKYRGVTSGTYYVELEYILYRVNGPPSPHYQDRFKDYTILCSGTLRSESYQLASEARKSLDVNGRGPVASTFAKTAIRVFSTDHVDYDVPVTKDFSEQELAPESATVFRASGGKPNTCSL